jgi:peptidoglycan DL-endopeptidase LytF
LKIEMIKLCSIPLVALTLLFQGCVTQPACVSPMSQYPEADYIESETIRSNYQETNHSEIISSDSHLVESGETLASIAKDYGRKPEELAALNGLSKPYILYPGQSLLIGEVPNMNYSTPEKKPLYKSHKKTSFPTLGARTTCYKNEHQVQRGENLSSIAKRYGQDYKKVAAWNHLSSPYQLKSGQCLRIRPVMRQTVASSSQQKSVSHIVRQGENLSSIAKNYGYSISEIARWNSLTSPYSLLPGQRLRVSPWPTKASPVQTFQKKQVTQSTGNVKYHTVVRGDTLYSLSKHYGYPIAEIVKWNRLQSPYTLSVGQRLQIGAQKATPACSPNPCAQNKSRRSALPHNTGYHTVVRGDTLYSISRRYGYPVSQIAAWNNLLPPYPLSNGQRLRVYPPSGILNKVRYKKALSRLKTSSFNSDYHTVQRGETLYSISKRYGHSVVQIARWNRLVPPYNLTVGDRLRVSSTLSRAHKTTRSRVSIPSSHSHIVKPGDTLISVAAEYGLTAYQLSKWNGIGSPYTIYPGQKLLLVAP